MTAKASSHRANTLSVAAHKTTGLHPMALNAHLEAQAQHKAAAQMSTSNDDKYGHWDNMEHHQDMASGHEEAMDPDGPGDASKTVHDIAKKKLNEEAPAPMSESENIRNMVHNISIGNHADAASDFDAMMDNRLDMKLTARTKELAAQIFGPSVIESVEPDADDEFAQDLQVLADQTLDALLDDEDAEVDTEDFIESFNAELVAQGITEYNLWRPKEQKDSEGVPMTRKGFSRTQRPAIARVSPRMARVNKRAADMEQQVKASGTKTHRHNEYSEEVEPVNEFLDKARARRHYIGHAEKQIGDSEVERKRAEAQGKPEVAKHFADRITKRKKGMKIVMGKQKGDAEKRAASANARLAAFKEPEEPKAEPKATPAEDKFKAAQSKKKAPANKK